jgi:Spy/CpxP family protein refolding chaperone
MRLKLAPALAALAIAVLSARGVCAAAPTDMRLHTDARYRRITMQLERLSAQLGLTEQQKAKVKPLIEARVTQVRDLRMDESLTQEEREARLQTIQLTFGTQLRAVLTPDQRKKLEEAKESRSARETVAVKKKGRVPVKDE